MRPSFRKAAHEAVEGEHVRGIRVIARRIEQISGDILTLNQGTLYPLLLKLEHEGSIVSQWGASENNRRARFYSLTATGRKQLQAETRDWKQTAAIIARFFEVKAEDLS
jgi:transcriptional regulator